MRQANMNRITKYIEALIFAAAQPISIEEIKAVLEEALGQTFLIPFIEEQVNEIIESYDNADSPFQIQQINGGYIYLSKPEYQDLITVYLKQADRKKLTNAALETLAIIAYKQPVTKLEIEQIRGVNSDYLLQKLLDKELISICGRSDAPGRPLLYGTSDKFMNYFGLKSISELPKLRDLKEVENTIGVGDPGLEN
jgi:segregation and condensation protein B